MFRELDKNPLLTAKPLCKLLGLLYRQYQDYVSHLRSKWWCDHKNERGSKCSSHYVHGWVKVFDWVDRELALSVSLRLTRARNRWLLWRDRLGRLNWFETGRVNFWVRQPASVGKVKQLICNAFAWSGLIEDNGGLARVLDSIRFKGAHDVWPSDQRLPCMRIARYARSNGVIIKQLNTHHINATARRRQNIKRD